MNTNKFESKDFFIRLAKQSDLADLAKLKQTVWQETYDGIYSDEKISDFDFELHAQKFFKVLQEKDSCLFVLQFKDAVVGYASCGKIKHAYQDFAHELTSLYILKDYHGRGMGREMFDFACKWFLEHNIFKFLINCNFYNTNANAFYQKMGCVLLERGAECEDKAARQNHYVFDIK